MNMMSKRKLKARLGPPDTYPQVNIVRPVHPLGKGALFVGTRIAKPTSSITLSVGPSVTAVVCSASPRLPDLLVDIQLFVPNTILTIFTSRMRTKGRTTSLRSTSSRASLILPPSWGTSSAPVSIRRLSSLSKKKKNTFMSTKHITLLLNYLWL